MARKANKNTGVLAEPAPTAGSARAKRAEMDETSIGGRLGALRREHRYSIRNLAERAGVSASLISDVERGKVEPSISTLKRLADALGTTLTYFFSEPTTTTSRVIRAGERAPLKDGSPGRSDAARSAMETSGVRFELASPPESTTIEAIFGRYEVGASMGESVTHDGEEWGMVLRGRLKVMVGEEIYFLDPGDAIAFPSTIPHRLENVADEATEYIWIDTPKSF